MEKYVCVNDVGLNHSVMPCPKKGGIYSLKKYYPSEKCFEFFEFPEIYGGLCLWREKRFVPLDEYLDQFSGALTNELDRQATVEASLNNFTSFLSNYNFKNE